MTVIATAGHVDHGKSTFVNFLTKQETDRLPEEKKRGLTINLGYTYFTIEDKTYSIVDVPGHKDFYKNTISGFANVLSPLKSTLVCALPRFVCNNVPVQLITFFLNF